MRWPCVDRTRARLVDELGVDPGPELAAAQLDVLRGRPAGRPAGPAPRPGAPDAAPDPPPGLKPGLNSFVGRDDDIVRIQAALGDSRLVTLTGPGGAGKTRLARVSVADPGAVAGVTGPPEVRLAELAPLGEPAQLPAAVLAAVGTPDLLTEKLARTQDDPDYDTTERLLERARRSAAGAGAGQLRAPGRTRRRARRDAAAQRCPRLRILATSREPLGIPGEAAAPGRRAAAARRGAAVRLLRRPGAQPCGPGSRRRRRRWHRR